VLSNETYNAVNCGPARFVLVVHDAQVKVVEMVRKETPDKPSCRFFLSLHWNVKDHLVVFSKRREWSRQGEQADEGQNEHGKKRKPPPISPMIQHVL